MGRLDLAGVTSASALTAWQRLRTQQWAVIDGAVGEAAAARLRQEIVTLRQVRLAGCCRVCGVSAGLALTTRRCNRAASGPIRPSFKAPCRPCPEATSTNFAYTVCLARFPSALHGTLSL